MRCRSAPSEFHSYARTRAFIYTYAGAYMVQLCGEESWPGRLLDSSSQRVVQLPLHPHLVGMESLMCRRCGYESLNERESFFTMSQTYIAGREFFFIGRGGLNDVGSAVNFIEVSMVHDTHIMFL